MACSIKGSISMTLSGLCFQSAKPSALSSVDVPGLAQHTYALFAMMRALLFLYTLLKSASAFVVFIQFRYPQSHSHAVFSTAGRSTPCKQHSFLSEKKEQPAISNKKQDPSPIQRRRKNLIEMSTTVLVPIMTNPKTAESSIGLKKPNRR